MRQGLATIIEQLFRMNLFKIVARWDHSKQKSRVS